jgi:hypothetical protein
MENPYKLVGKRVDIVDKDSIWCGHWGFIKMYNGDVYHVNGGSISIAEEGLTPVFDREQFKVRRIKK